MAFAFVNYKDPNEVFDDEAEYGETQAFYKTWGDPENPGTFFKPLAIRPCTRIELNLEEGSAYDMKKFWPYHESHGTDISAFAHKFMCIDQNLEVYGSYNSAKA